MRPSAAVAAAFLLTSVAAAQDPQAPPRQVFRSSVDLVHLDVSVLDRNRHPVRGLRAADFTVLEDGKPQRITVFNAVELPDPEPAAATWVRTVAPDVRSNEGLQDRRLFLIIVDDATLQSDLNALKNMREVGRTFVEKLGPSDLAAVVLTRDNRHSQDYTTDRGRLVRAIEKAGIGFRDMAPPEVGPDDYAFMSSLNTLESALEVLNTLPDRRKAIVYIGQGVPVDISFLAPAALGLVENGPSGAMTAALMARLTSQMTKIFERAANANVNIYTLDVCGLRVPPGPSQAAGSTQPTLFSTSGYARPTCVPGLEVEYLRTIAGATGGRAVADSNDFEPGIENIFAENASYYLLGYQPADPSNDGNFRRLEVRVNRPGVQVRTRRGYSRESSREIEKRQRASPVATALSGILPKSDLPLQMVAIPLAIPGKREAAVAITIGVRQPVNRPAQRVTERVDLEVRAFNVEGKAQGGKSLKTDVTIRAGASGMAEYEVMTRLDLRPGRYQLRAAGHVGRLSTSGSLYYDIDVPDFRKEPLALSGLAIAVSPPLAVGARDALADVLPVIPTTVREFGPEDQVVAFARLYQGGSKPLADAAVVLQIRDRADNVMVETRQPMPAGRFSAARAADIELQMPVARLAAGQYLLTIEATSGPSIARRASRFRVIR